MIKPAVSESNKSRTIVRARDRATLAQARAAGFLGDAKDARIAGRVSSALIEAVKSRTGIASDTDVIELALATLALEDDFGTKLVRRKGSVSQEIDLEF